MSTRARGDIYTWKELAAAVSLTQWGHGMVHNNSNGAHGSAKPCREICLGFSECLASVSCRVRCLGHSPLFRCLYSCEDKRVVSGGLFWSPFC